MRYMVHYNPKKNYDKGLYDFDTMLNNLFGTVNSDSRRAPVVDVIENENSYIIEAEVPGYSQEEIDVQVEDGVLTISASPASDQSAQKESDQDQSQDEEITKGTYLVHERSSSLFTRSFSLPKDVDVEQIEGSYKNGILRLELTKAAESKPRSIKVNAA